MCYINIDAKVNMCDNGIETPKFYMIRYDDQYTIIAMELTKRYCFNINNEWISVPINQVNALMEKIDSKLIDRVKNSIQNANKLSISLLIACYMMFNAVPDIFKSLVNDIKEHPKVSSIRQIGFIPITTHDIKNNCSVDSKIWKIIYINKIVKTIGYPPIIRDWKVIIGSYRYIFTNDTHFDISVRLIQLKNAIAQIKDEQSSEEIKTLSNVLNESIHKFNFNLPDICIAFEYPEYQQPIFETTEYAKLILLLILKLAHQGIINNYPEISNIRYDQHHKHINFINYENSILSTDHTELNNFEHMKDTINEVYEKDSKITANYIQVFNCYVMYEVIRAMLSIQSDNEKINSIVVDANKIMSGIYDSPKYKYPYDAIDALYEKHFGKHKYVNTFNLYKSNDRPKMEFLSNYIYEGLF